MADELIPPEATTNPIMPLAAVIPARPVSGAPIASAWGTDVHDRIYTPKGCIVGGAATAVPVGPLTRLALDTLTAGDVAMLDAAGDRVVIPAGAGGLYAIEAAGTVAGPAAGAAAQVLVFAGPSASTPFIVGCVTPCFGAAAYEWSMGACIATIDDGQIVFVSAAVSGAAAASYQLRRLSVHRIGHALA